MKRIFEYLRREEGTSLVEYALLTVLFAVPSLIAIDSITTGISENFNQAAAISVPVDTGDSGDSEYGAGDDDSGNTGDSGDVGDSGDSGDTGDSGDVGDTGDSGDGGDTGDSGDVGDSGDSGDTGDSGNVGDSGDSGGTGDNPGDNTPPAEQFVTAGSDGGWITFTAADGDISIDDYQLNRRWRGQAYPQGDGSLVVVIWRNERVFTFEASLDDDGFLQVSVH